MAEQAQYRGTGKRKTSVARVILRPGDGTTWFNGRDIATYFPRASRASTTFASACTAAARPGRPVRCATGSPGRSSRRTRRSAWR